MALPEMTTNVKNLSQTEVDIRDSFARFPNFIQNIITFISGKAIAHEKPFIHITPVSAITIDFLKLFLGIFSSLYFISLQDPLWYLLPLSYILTVNGARSLASDAHYGAHGCITAHKKIDFWIGDIISTLILSQNMTTYANPHTKGHHSKDGISTVDDPDIGLLFMLNFKPQQSIRWYWIKMLCCCISPQFHLSYFFVRIKTNLIDCPNLRMFMTIIIHSLILKIIHIYDLWIGFLIAVIIPLILLIPISALLQFCCEHVWLAQRIEGETTKHFIRRLSHGRFCLIMAPPANQPFIQNSIHWARWSIQMLFPLFCRFFILVSILPSHDYHHRKAQQLQWPMEPYLRQADIDAGEKDYKNYYNILDVYRTVFSALNAFPSKSFHPHNVKTLDLLL